MHSPEETVFQAQVSRLAVELRFKPGEVQASQATVPMHPMDLDSVYHADQCVPRFQGCTKA